MLYTTVKIEVDLWLRPASGYMYQKNKARGFGEF